MRNEPAIDSCHAAAPPMDAGGEVGGSHRAGGDRHNLAREPVVELLGFTRDEGPHGGSPRACRATHRRVRPEEAILDRTLTRAARPSHGRGPVEPRVALGPGL